MLFSRWERVERNKPRPVVLDENGEPVEYVDPELEELDEEQVAELMASGAKGPLLDSEMVTRECDNSSIFNREVEYYNKEEREPFDQFIEKMYDSTFIRVDMSGLTPTELSDSVLARVRPSTAEPLRPIAIHIEDGAGSFKELLTAGQDDENEGLKLPRQWSLWKTMDPVSLAQGKVEAGVPEFAAHFGNNVFAFQNEDNLKAFIKQPRNYISDAPQMPPNFRLLMMGPRGIGVRTQAKKLEELYGWRVVDFKKIVQDKLREILGWEKKPPNNITDEAPCSICLSQEELDSIKSGAPFPSWKFLPWVLEFLGVPLCISDPPPPEQASVTDSQWSQGKQTAHKNKKKATAKAAAAAAAAAQ